MNQHTKASRAPRAAKATEKTDSNTRTVTSKDDAWAMLKYQRDKRSNMEGIAIEAATGDPECAMHMIEAAAVELESAKGMTDAVRGYLIDCLGRVLSGEPPNKAFGFSKSGGGAKSSFWKKIRDADIAKAVAYKIDNGMSREAACNAVASTQCYGFKDAGVVDVEAVGKAFSKFYKVK